ncbi:molecular chaperone [Achromobacter piechaudii]|uniref:Gram-negative pili assembly chaperone domain protein n=1 Tax=Achromobacter piechaudii ATCC 43553 TaxID=742159 RepID=D4XFN5_9BURK|nr:molecular chaperone [Achromobacter piechaudii]EFF74327.1 gram-negative pili assembly chaperone domain protein [Achromobacter piechaudii ATCC 43553]
MTLFFRRILPACLAASSLFAGSAAHAAIQLSSTRAIMNEKDRNVALFAKNLTSSPYVVQAWIDGDGEEMETPFFITPPLSRFDAASERSLNVTRVGDDFPKDRESYYWINVLEIPQKSESADNSLTLATRTRIKLFYRPEAIQKLPRGAEQSKWSFVRDGKSCRLAVDNTSAYTINFARIDVPGQPDELGKAVIAKPLETTYIPLDKCPTGALSVTPQVVNDYGVIDAWPTASAGERNATDIEAAAGGGK